jgi:glycosyltransferase involved in cell wall biosynthesis
MSPRLDVALIAPYPPRGVRHGGHSGVASYTANLAHGLVEHGVDVTVIAPELPGDPAEYTDGAVAVRRAFPLGGRAMPSALAAARATGARLVHVQWELFLYGRAGPLGLLPALARSRVGRSAAPVVTTLHQVVDPATVDHRYARLHRLAVPSPVARLGIAGLQAAITTTATATIVHEEPFRRVVPRSTVIPHGIEKVGPMDRLAARARLGLDGNRLVVVCFGFVAPYKGVELLLDAAGWTGPDVAVVVAGGDHPRMGGEQGFAAELRARYGDVARFTGWVPDDDVPAWFAAADLALFPYPKPFSSSGALALALAHGTPVLLSPALARCAGAPSVLAAPMEARPLARRLDELATDAGALDELRRWTALLAAGRQWPAVAQQHVRLYEELST